MKLQLILYISLVVRLFCSCAPNFAHDITGIPCFICIWCNLLLLDLEHLVEINRAGLKVFLTSQSFKQWELAQLARNETKQEVNTTVLLEVTFLLNLFCKQAAILYSSHCKKLQKWSLRIPPHIKLIYHFC